MIPHSNIIAEMLCHAAAGPVSSLPEAGDETLIHTEAWALLALRGEWLGRILQQLAMAGRAGSVPAEAAFLRRQLLESGVLQALLHTVDQLTGEPDHKRWARRIVARMAAGETNVTPYQARAALEALCSAPEKMP